MVGAAAAVLIASALAVASSAPRRRKIEPLNQYVVSGGDQSKLGELGYDVTEGGSAKGQGVVGDAGAGRGAARQGLHGHGAVR